MAETSLYTLLQKHLVFTVYSKCSQCFQRQATGHAESLLAGRSDVAT